MKITIRKIGNSVGAIIPNKFHAKPGTQYKIDKIGDTFVMTPIRDNLFADPTDWVGFRDSVSKEDRAWDEVQD